LSVELTEAELMAADCAVIVTNHSVVDYARVVAYSALVLDTRNVTAAIKAPHVLHFTEQPAPEPDRLFLMRSMPQVAAAL
jgi:UDP-N-acetyl-D-mannosaminuronate dehydrogenase